MLAVEIGRQRGGDRDDEFGLLPRWLHAFFTVTRPFLRRIAPQRAEGRFHGTRKQVRALLDVVAEGHPFPGYVVQDAFHRARSMADRAAEIRLGAQGEISDGAFNPFRSRDSARCLQLALSRLRRVLKSIVSPRDNLSSRQFPPDP